MGDSFQDRKPVQRRIGKVVGRRREFQVTHPFLSQARNALKQNSAIASNEF